MSDTAKPATLPDALRADALAGTGSPAHREECIAAAQYIEGMERDLLETQRAAALLETTAETLNQVVTDMARELGCEADNEVILAAIAGLKRDAGRYRFIRNVPADELGKTGRPCVADPDGPKKGRYVSEQDADEAIDRARDIQ